MKKKIKERKYFFLSRKLLDKQNYEKSILSAIASLLKFYKFKFGKKLSLNYRKTRKKMV